MLVLGQRQPCLATLPSSVHEDELRLSSQGGHSPQEERWSPLSWVKAAAGPSAGQQTRAALLHKVQIEWLCTPHPADFTWEGRLHFSFWAE